MVALASVTGTLVGVRRLLGKWWDEGLMRITDIFFAFPSLILAMAIARCTGTEPAQRPDRRGSGDLADLRAWREAGVGAAPRLRRSRPRRRRGPRPILRRHLFPNMLSPLLDQASFDMGTTILSVAGLSFIGFGAQPPTPEWGVMISEGRSYITTHWWLTFFPAIATLLSVAGFAW